MAQSQRVKKDKPPEIDWDKVGTRLVDLSNIASKASEVHYNLAEAQPTQADRIRQRHDGLRQAVVANILLCLAQALSAGLPDLEGT